MRIHVRAEKCHLWVPLPNCLLRSRLTAHIMANSVNSHANQNLKTEPCQPWPGPKVHMTTDQAAALLRAVADAGPMLQGEPLVDVHTSDGTKVHISL